MSNDIYGRGLEDVIELQRQVNELDSLMCRQLKLTTSEDPFERIQQIARAQLEFREQVDTLLTARAKGDET